jgi:hypothetical protein
MPELQTATLGHARADLHTMAAPSTAKFAHAKPGKVLIVADKSHCKLAVKTGSVMALRPPLDATRVPTVHQGTIEQTTALAR